MSWLTKLFRSSPFENPSVSLNPATWLNVFNKSASGEVVNVETAMSISAMWAAWRLLAESFASFQVDVVLDKDGRIQVDRNHPNHKLIKKSPNDIQTSFSFRESMMLNALAFGACYAEIDRESKYGDIEQLVVLQANLVTPWTYKGKLYYKVEGKNKTLLPHEIVAIPIMSFDGVNVNPVLTKARNILGEMLAAQRLTGDYYANGARVSGVIQTDQDLTQPQRESLQSSFDSKMGGKGSNRGGTALLSNGLKYVPISSNMKEAEILQMRNFYIQEVSRLYNISPHLLHEHSRSTFNNISSLDQGFAKYTMRPYVKRWEEELDRKLFPEDTGHSVQFNMDSVLRADSLTRAKVHQLMRMYVGVTGNEIRQLEGLPPQEGLDDPTPLFVLQTNPEKNGDEKDPESED